MYNIIRLINSFIIMTIFIRNIIAIRKNSCSYLDYPYISITYCKAKCSAVHPSSVVALRSTLQSSTRHFATSVSPYLNGIHSNIQSGYESLNFILLYYWIIR